MFGLFGGKNRAKPLVLVVDDEEDIRGIITVVLRSMNLDVLSAANGPEGLKLALKEQPDLVLLDIRMPGMDGFDVCRSIKVDKEGNKIPILMVTAMDQHKDVEKALANGADGYIVKPIDNSKFKRKIAEFLKLPPADPA
ncbi:MAG: response regulator [Elusimicrobia bacterium]|nr:response regulator [Elusimicrobiota bacterium]